MPIFNQHRLIAILTNIIHGMSDKNNRLLLTLRVKEKVLTLLLESLIANGKNLIKNKNVSLRLNRDGKGKPHLHTTGVVLELLLHEIAQLGKIDDIVIHGVNFVFGEAQHCAIQIHILSAGQLRVETNAKLNEGDKLALNLNATGIRRIDLRNDFQQRRFSRTVLPDNAKEIALMHFKGDVLQNFLNRIPMNTTNKIEQRVLQAARFLRRKLEAFRDVRNLERNIRSLLHIFLHYTSSANNLERDSKNTSPPIKMTTDRATGIKPTNGVLNDCHTV